MGAYGDFVRARRGIFGMSQRDLAERAGVKQPLIAAIEAGHRRPSDSARAALDRALVSQPSVALVARREEVRALFARAGLPEPRVFGSVARGDDQESSDLDLIVEFTERHDIVDLLTLEHDLEELLTVAVDIVDARTGSRVLEHARTGGRAVTGDEPDPDAERVRRRLRELADFGADAAYTVDLGIGAYLDDSPQGRVLRNNGRHILIQVATVVEKLPATFKDACDDVDWVAIGRMRNFIAHHYDKVDDRLVFTALAYRIPNLLGRLGLDG